MEIKTIVILAALFLICACHSVKNDTQNSRENVISALQKQYVYENFEPYMVYSPDYCETLFDNLDVNEVDVR